MGLFDGTALERPVACEQCGELLEACDCPPPSDADEIRTPPVEQTVRLAVEKRKKGKSVTVVRGLVDEGDHLSEMLATLRNACGAGGTAKAGEIAIQGRQLDRVREVLAKLGYRVQG